MRKLYALALSLALLSAGCFAPQTPQQKLVETARDANLAARFGRMDLAIEVTDPGMRDSFMKRRTDWGRNIRVLDVQLAGMNMPDTDNATIVVDFAWTRIDEGIMRTTRVEQSWEDKGKGWALVREKRAGGDFGLFGEKVTVLSPEPRGDVHFPTRTIR